MSSPNYQIPWAQGKTYIMDVLVAVYQGQPVGATGALATKGTSGGADGIAAMYIAAASSTGAKRLGMYQDCVIRDAALALGSAGDPVYLGAAGTFTLDEPVAGDSDIKQRVGTVLPSGDVQIDLHSQASTAEVLWQDFVSTLAWTTGTPGTITKTGRYREYANRVEGDITISSADGNGATVLTCTLPVAPKNNSAETAINAQQLQNATWADPMGYIDQSDALIHFEAFVTCTDAQAVEFKIHFVYEKASSIITAWADFTPDTTWTGTEPDSLVTTARYYVENSTCHFEITMADADPGAAGTALTIACPVAAADNSAETPLIAQELNDTSWLNPMCYVAQATSLISFEAFGASADDEAFELKISGSYAV